MIPQKALSGASFLPQTKINAAAAPKAIHANRHRIEAAERFPGHRSLS